MNAFQRGLSRPIPLDKAASFFTGLKNWQSPSREDDELMARCVKEAAAKLAEEALTTDGPPMAAPSPAAAPQSDDYLANEEAAMEAEATNALRYYQERLEAARAETAALQEQLQSSQQQVEQLTMQQQNHDSQIQGAQQEGQLAQQAALQQVQTANQQASQAMQQAVDAENRALMAKGQESAAKIQQQQVRSQLFDLASQGLPGTEPELGGAGNAAEGLAPEAPPEQPGDPAVASEEGGGPPEGDPQATEGGEGGQEAPTSDQNQQGEPASAEGMPGEEASPEGAGAAASPGAVQPPADSSGGAGSGSGTGPQARGDGSDSAPEQDPTAKRNGQISIKVGSAEWRAKLQARLDRLEERRTPPEDRPKTASAAAALKNPRVLGALAGGVLGAGAAGIEASGHGPDLDKLRGRVAAGEEAAAKPGLRGFGSALELAKDKAMLTLGEATQRHPVAATITGGLMGAQAGAAAGPQLANLIREAASFHRG